MIINVAEDKRKGEERRATTVSHEMLHDLIMEHHGEIRVIKQDVHEIKNDMEPITQGVNTMVVMFKILIVMGMGAAALVGILEVWEHFGHVGDHIHE